MENDNLGITDFHYGELKYLKDRICENELGVLQALKMAVEERKSIIADARALGMDIKALRHVKAYANHRGWRMGDNRAEIEYTEAVRRNAMAKLAARVEDPEGKDK